MSYYLDTSFTIAAFTSEDRTAIAQGWISANLKEELYISQWGQTEFSSALSMKIRTGDLTIENRAKILVNWRTFEASSLGMINIASEDFLTAARFADHYDLSLRASDALHIAIAHAAGRMLVTLDKKMADAAIVLGVPVAKI